MRHHPFILVLIALLGLPALSADAQIRFGWHRTVWSDDFASLDTTRTFLGRDARLDMGTGKIELNPDLGGVGSVVLRRRLPMDAWDVSFDAFFGANPDGADGLAFLAGRRYDYALTGGGDLGFEGCNGYGVEFDTFHNDANGDPQGDHIAVLDGSVRNHAAWTVVPRGWLTDGRWHRVRVTLRGVRITVRVDTAVVLTHTLPAPAAYDGYIGISGSTGQFLNRHAVDNVVAVLPERRADTLGVVNACDSAALRFSVSIANNHSTGGSLAVTSIGLAPGSDPRISFVPPPQPVVLAQGDSMAIAVTATLAGLVRDTVLTAVLRLFEAQGETVDDTLRVRVVVPRAAWATQTITMKPTVTGFPIDTLVTLSNPSSTAVTLDSIGVSDPSFRILDPTTFPLVIPAGGALQVRVQFAARTQDGAVRAVIVAGSCGGVDSLRIEATAASSSCRNPEGLVLAAAALLTSHPNPFTGTATIALVLGEDADVVLTLNDAYGYVVRNLAEGPLPRGLHQFRVDSLPLSSGVYRAVLRIGADILMHQMVCIK